MSWVPGLFRSAPKVKTEEQKKRIYGTFHRVWRKKIDKELKNFGVLPGQDPVFVAAKAIDLTKEQTRQEALKKTAARHRLLQEALLSILKEGDTAKWEK